MDENPLKPEYFERYDEAPDRVFYQPVRLVKHIDDAACEALAKFYGTILPEEGAILDLMSSWVSHLPGNGKYDQMVAMGMNVPELAANKQATSGLICDLNQTPVLPFQDASFDACILAVSVQYLTQPEAVFREVGRVLKPGAPFAVSYSNRMFPTKAVAIWQAIDDEERAKLINLYFERAELFDMRTFHNISPAQGQSDPLYVIKGHRKAE